MACIISDVSINALAVDADNNPTALIIQGSQTGSCQQLFVQINGGIGVLATVAGDSFVATFTLGEHYQPGEITCGVNNDMLLSIQCLSGDTCQYQQTLGMIECPTCAISFAPNAVTGVAGELTDTPTQVTISGTVSGCESLEARFIYAGATTTPNATQWREAVIVDGQWQVSFTYDPAGGTADDYPKAVVCGQNIVVEARCGDDETCFASETFPLVCHQGTDCPEMELTAVINRGCTQNRRLVRFTVTLSGVTDDTDISGHIATGDTSIGLESLIPVSYAVETSSAWTANGNTRQRTYDYTYPPGAYAPSLIIEGTCAAAVPLGEITDADGNALPELEIAVCDCPEATIAVTVCRVTDPGLTCDNDIPDNVCEAVSESELTEPLAPGVYRLTAVTTPSNAGPITWSQDGNAVGDGPSDTYCLTLAGGESLAIVASVNLGLYCHTPGDAVILTTVPDDDGGGGDGGGDGDDGGDGGDGGDNGDGDGTDTPPADGCMIDFCRLWLLINISLTFLAGAAIIITACILFTTTGVLWPFWVGVGVSVALVLASIVSFILWALVCGRFRRLCGPLTWVHDILLFLAAASGIMGLILLFGQPPCGIGFLIDFAYFGVLAAILQAILRFMGCPLAQNGIIGVIVAIFNWVTDALGLGGGS